ncbi:MAG: SCO family protein, partial [Acidobacteria bacterium]|nr:SCO family protein [Acidobacteriota bacterium]
MRYFFFVFISVLFISACDKAEPQRASDAVKRYPLKGKIVSVDKQKKTAVVEHDEVPGFMEPMTMNFPIREDWVWNDLTPGSDIRAELVVDSTAAEPYWLEKIGIVAAPDPNRPPPIKNENFAQIGKSVPDFQLTNQDGRQISMTDFRGKATAITFIYAQCPLPDFCIRMSTNFSDLANQLKNDPRARESIRLLTISFDPARDTP